MSFFVQQSTVKPLLNSDRSYVTNELPFWQIGRMTRKAKVIYIINLTLFNLGARRNLYRQVQ